jgi:hypothetical protein
MVLNLFQKHKENYEESIQNFLQEQDYKTMRC